MSGDEQTTEALVVFTPSGKRGKFACGTSLLSAARSLGVDIDSVCGGRAICGRCQVDVCSGEFAKHGIVCSNDNLTGISKAEARYDEKRGLPAGRRLSCQAIIKGDIVIDVPPESQVHKQVIRKRAEARNIKTDPVISFHYIEVEEPDIHKPSSDLERVYRALRDQWNLLQVSCDLRILSKLQAVLRKGEWAVTIGVHHRLPGGISQIVSIRPSFHDSAYGLAVDVGSTTIAAHLCNLADGKVLASSGLMNPQIRFGEDLMSRISYAMANPGADLKMSEEVREAINMLAAQSAATAGIDQSDILEVVLVGNPVMHHILLGIDPVELGRAPFTLATSMAITRPACELGLKLPAGAYAYLLPCIAGHLGADAAGVILSESPHLRDEMSLIVDVGTNAEIILGNKDRLLACSSPTGPAFEGAQISCGQRAAPGAIERVRINPETLEPRFCVIGCDLWSDDPGFSAAIGSIGVSGICGSGIIEAIAEMYLAGIINKDGALDGSLSVKSPRIRANGRTFDYVLNDAEPLICVTQNDVREIQLAKATLYAGARLLMDRMGVDVVDRIRLAGAFGSHIDVKYAMILGLVPDCELDKVESAGNAAGTGARIALLNRGARDEIEQLVRKIEKIETAVEPRFQEHLVDAMAIPHKRASYLKLASQVTMPATGDGGAGQRGARRKRGNRRVTARKSD